MTVKLATLRQMAFELRISPKALAAWLERWPDFPIVKRGTNGRHYQFDPPAVHAFLKNVRAAEKRQVDAIAEILAKPELMDLPMTRVWTMKDRIDAVRLSAMARVERERSAELVEAGAMREVLMTSTRTWAIHLDRLWEDVAREHNLPGNLVDDLKARLSEATRCFQAALSKILPPPKQGVAGAAQAMVLAASCPGPEALIPKDATHE